LKGELKWEDCDSKDVYEFLSLLKQLKNIRYTNQFNTINIEEWRTMVKRSKKRSTLSIYSKQNYILYKYTLSSIRLTTLLVQYYNLIIQKQYYPTRWLKTLDVTIEKGKGLVIRKLRII